LTAKDVRTHTWKVEGVAAAKDVSDSTAGHDLNLSTAKPQFNGQLDGLTAPDLQRDECGQLSVFARKCDRGERHSWRSTLAIRALDTG